MPKNASALLVSAVFVLVMVSAQLLMLTSAAATPSSGEVERAEAIVGLAEKALLRVESFINEAKKASLGANVTDAEKLYGEGKALLNQAEVAIRERNYGEATSLAISAMERLREARMGLAQALEHEGVGEDSSVKAQGLLVAASRTLERIARLEKSLPEVQATLEAAKSLLNIDSIAELLREGNVSGAAHAIAEANRLISQALKSMAEEALPRRMERFVEKLQERYGGIVDRLKAAGVNFTEHGMEKFQESILHLKETIKSTEPKGAKGLMGQLGSLAKGLSKLEDRVAPLLATPAPSKIEGVPGLSVRVDAKKVTGNLKWVTLEVVVENVGSVILRFQNTVYGLTIERKNRDGVWEPYYSPVSAQALVSLEPGQAAHVVLKLKQPSPGEYRVRVQGTYEEGKQPLEATAEFSLP
ncbi:MAG: hypothetical protein B9J98_01870 [Candidatus Terraquivivens tikiterensis]|uniref:Uncharacterized protein n=1 Tax=Candidatus Terraquivivens tikiterensis TaxID=1980982 RepID=A0A2R7YA16_9ARCH|nr:MAG: hypothetical protein B9J98_01870 [Candidatus Terraquivivens tikiterensis]